MEKFRLYAQSLEITLESWFASFICIFTIRTFLEQYSSYQSGHFPLIDLPTIVHYGVSYLGILLVLMIILIIFSSARLKEVAAITILGFPILWIVPAIDLITGGIGGHLISYFFVSGKELLIKFFTYFGGNVSVGVTLGIRIEVLLVAFFCFLYTYSATQKVSRAIVAAIAFYFLIFMIFAIPSIVSLFGYGYSPVSSFVNSLSSSHIITNNIHPNFSANNNGTLDLGINKLLTQLNLIIVLIAASVLLFKSYREKFISVIKNSRIERIIFFFLLFLFGSILSGQKIWALNWVDVLSFVLAYFSFIFAWIFSVCQNDIEDEKIDAISNLSRPLITGGLSKSELVWVSKICLFFSLLTAYTVSHYNLFFVCLFIFVYFIYSNPPLKLKRFVLINSFLVSLACLSVTMAGFFMLNQDKSLLTFNPSIVLFIIIFLTAAANVKDIKDTDGDAANGIKTLPVLLGLKPTKKIIAGTICIFFLIIPWYFSLWALTIPSILASIFSWYFINQEEYKEWKSFVVYILYLISIIVVITFK